MALSLRKVRPVVAVWLTMWLGAIARGEQVPLEGAGVLRFEETVIDLGEVGDHEPVRQGFQFVNASDQPVRLDFDYCHLCTKVTADREEYGAGERGIVSFELRPQGKRGGMSTDVTVSAVGVRNSGVRLSLRAVVRPWVLVESEDAFMRVRKGEGATATVTVRGRTPGFEVTGASSGSEHLRVEAAGEARPDPETGPDYVARDYTVTLERDAPLGKLESEVVFTTNDPRVPRVRQRITAEISGDLYTVPEMVLAPKVTTDRPFTVRFEVRARSGRAVRVSGVDVRPLRGVDSVAVDAQPKADGRSVGVVVCGVARGGRARGAPLLVLIRGSAGEEGAGEETLEAPVRLGLD